MVERSGEVTGVDIEPIEPTDLKLGVRAGLTLHGFGDGGSLGLSFKKPPGYIHQPVRLLLISRYALVTS